MGDTAATHPPRSAVRIALRSTLWLFLSGWIGGFGVFAFVVAPNAFQVLPSTEIAGTLVGPILETLHLYGAMAGVAISALAWALGRGIPLRVLPLLLTAACLYSQFGVSAEIAEIRHLTFGPEGDIEAAARFSQLHRISMSIFSGVLLGAISLLILHAREDETAARRV